MSGEFVVVLDSAWRSHHISSRSAFDATPAASSPRPLEQAIKQIEKEVADWLEQQGVPPISRETILRAAGKK